MTPYRFHILGLPHTVTNKDYVACAYTQKVWKFGKMMKQLGHEIIHYGHSDSDVICDEHVTVINNDDLLKAYGSYDWHKNFFKFSNDDHAYQTFYKNAIDEIQKRKQKNDFILPFWGSGVRAICDAHQDMICVEPGIGYAGGHWAKWKIFESYAIYHAYCGLENVGKCNQGWYDCVIPNYFDPDDFIFKETRVVAKINSRAGQSLNKIIDYIKENFKFKNPGAEISDDDIISSFNFLFENYSRWDEFHQGQKELHQIESNLVNIIAAINKPKQNKENAAISKFLND